MTQDEQIETSITKAIAIIEEEIEIIRVKQEEKGLERLDMDKVLDCLKVLVLVQKDRRQSSKEDDIDLKELSQSELDLEIEKEAKRLKGQSDQ